MEYSSPLAAMRPQPCPAWGNRKDLPIPRSMFHGGLSYGQPNFDFKHLSMYQKPQPPKADYFGYKPVQGSSPTSGVIADFEANFHVDRR